jgi:hypothetical protein
MNVILVSLLVGKMWYDINQRLKVINQRFKDHNWIMEKTSVFGSDLFNFLSTIWIGHPIMNNNGPCNIQYVTNDDIASSNSKMMVKVKTSQAHHFHIHATKKPLPTYGVEPRWNSPSTNSKTFVTIELYLYQNEANLYLTNTWIVARFFYVDSAPLFTCNDVCFACRHCPHLKTISFDYNELGGFFISGYYVGETHAMTSRK